MGHTEKTIFLSYRRTNVAWALAVFQSLKGSGYDVFLDYLDIASGDFAAVIEENIHARAHFLVLLTPSALDRCSTPGDWLRREIETAIHAKRNIVPLMFEGFHFSSPSIASQLTGTLETLPRYNALTVYPEYFPDGMRRLCEEFLNIPLDAVLQPPSEPAQRIAKQQQDAASGAPLVQKEELTAQAIFERAFAEKDPNEQLRLYTQLIQLQPANADAYYNRGCARERLGDPQGAIQDYTQAIRWRPDDPDPYHGRGNARYDLGDLNGAIGDYNRAIRLNPRASDIYVGRGLARYDNSDTKGAMEDYAQAISVNPKAADAYNARGYALQCEGDSKAAIEDYTKAIALKPDYAEAYANRAYARSCDIDLNGAVDDYNKAIENAPGTARTYYTRGWILMQQEKFQDALKDLQKYLDLGGGDSAGDRPQVEQMIRDLKSKLTT
jgi:tetratricopeptide (TPR) repeat protein